MNYIIIPGIGQLVDGNESQEEHSSGEATTLGSGGEIWLKTGEEGFLPVEVECLTKDKQPKPKGN